MADVDVENVEEVVAEEPKKVAKPKYEGPACSVCGKPLTDPESIKAGIGPLCRAKGWTKELVAARMAEIKKDVVPEGWLKLADVDRRLRQEGIPIARLVRAIGGDRAMDPAIEGFEVVYVGRSRYMSPFVLTDEGMAILRDKHLGQPAPEKKPRAKKEKTVKVITDSDGNTGKPKRSKKVDAAPADVNDLWKSN